MRTHYMRTVLLAMAILAIAVTYPTGAQSGTEDKPKLAIFPGWLPGIAANYTHVIMNAVYDVLDETEIFDPVYSYYTGDDRYSPKSLPGDIGKDNWYKKGFFSGYEPNTELILKKGKELGVDAVLLYSVEIVGGGYDRMTGYLFNVAKGSVYHHRLTDEIKHNYTGEISEQTLRSKLREINYLIFYKY